MIESTGVIFDMDGVLVSTDRMHATAWRALCDEEGIDFEPTRADECRGLDRMSSLKLILRKAGRVYNDEQMSVLADRKNTHYQARLAKMSPADVGGRVVELLLDLRRRGIKLAVASSSRNAQLILERTELIKRFDAVADGNDVEHAKPNPEVFLLAAKRLGIEPSHCLVIEDAVAGVQAARSAGMGVFGIGLESLRHEVDAWADSLGNLKADVLLKHLAGRR